MSLLDTKTKPITNRARNPEQASLLADTIIHRDELTAVITELIRRMPLHYRKAARSGVNKILTEDEDESASLS